MTVDPRLTNSGFQFRRDGGRRRRLSPSKTWWSNYFIIHRGADSPPRRSATVYRHSSPARLIMLTSESLNNQRKIRKGTRSCWECKRRKIRCIFPASGEAICVCCQRRRVPCIGQEIPESLALARKGNRSLGDRIARVEDAMKDLLAGKDIGAASQIEEEPRQLGQSPHSDAFRVYASSLTPSSARALPTPAEVSGMRPPLLHELLSDRFLDS